MAVPAMKGGGRAHKLFSRIIFFFPGSFLAKHSSDTATMRTIVLDQWHNFLNQIFFNNLTLTNKKHRGIF
jgi:hypothetical protein